MLLVSEQDLCEYTETFSMLLIVVGTKYGVLSNLKFEVISKQDFCIIIKFQSLSENVGEKRVQRCDS